MKYPTLQKVMLASMALVASLAFSAQAGTPSLSSARSTHGAKSIHYSMSAKMSGRSNPADFTYAIDDGNADDSIGLTAGGDEICLNKFTVVPGDETITSVSIAWGTPVFPDPTLDGLSYTAVIWSDPTGNPGDAVVLATAPGVVSQQGTNTFITTDFPPTTITTPTFYVGFLITQQAGQFPAAFDEQSPVYSNVSFIAGDTAPGTGDIYNLNNNELPVAAIESYGLIGNWLIRATSNGSGTPSPTPTPTPNGNMLWYNGDFNDVNGLSNELDTSLGSDQFGSVYDDFNVTDESGWNVTSVYSDNLLNTNVTGANWEIRQGISEGNGGTVVASGMTMTPTVTATGRSGFGYTEYMVEVDGLNVDLSPGTYFLNVTPIGDLTGRSFDSTTSGANCVGTPCGNNQNAFFNSNFFGANFTSTANEGQPYDFSMGVNGTVNGQGGGFMLSSAQSLKTHGTMGTFGIPLPLTGDVGIEDRGGKSDVIEMTFSGNVTSVGGATSTCGNPIVSIDPTDAHNVYVRINNSSSCDQMVVTITLTDVMDDMGNDLSSVPVSYGKLFGDVNGDGIVNKSDYNIVRSEQGQNADSTNFRSDVNIDGRINTLDRGLVKKSQGHSLP